MANRFSQTTTAGFKGLSLDEIMAIPLAKQTRQDASLAATDELQALEAKRLESDAPVVDAELERIRKESEQISKDLMERGVDRNLSNKLRSLRSSQKKSFGASGVVGQAEANYKSAQTYINDLATKKEQQAGWSPQQAKLWATTQVKNFGSSFDELGNFRQFQGSGMSSKVESNDWINKNLKLIASDTNQDTMKYAGNLDQFNKAYSSGLVTEKDFNKIMSSLTIMASNDPDLQASLKQQQFFDPNAGDPKNIGTWSVKYRDDGSKVDVFTPGNEFGRQLYGAALGGQSKEQTYKYHFESDYAAKALFDAGLEEKEANSLVRAADGILNTITPDNINEIRENTDLALKTLDRKTGELAANWTPERIAANPDAYAIAQKELNDSKVKYFNLKNRIDSIEKETFKELTPKEQEGKKLYDKVRQGVPGYDQARNQDEAITSLTEAIRKLPGGVEVVGKTGTLSEIGTGSDEMENFLLSKYFEMTGEKVNKNSRANRSIFNWWGSEDLAYDDGIVDRMKDGNMALKDKSKKYLEQNPYSESYTEFGALNSGKYSSKIGAINKNLSDNFLGAGYSEAYTGMSINQYVQENYPTDPSSSEAKYNFEVRTTDGLDAMGYPIEHLVIKDKNGGVIEVKSVTRGESGRQQQKEVAIELMKSTDPGLQEKGRRMMANHEMLPMIKQNGGLRTGAIEGKFTGKNSTVVLDGNEVPIVWKKETIGDQEIWKIHVGGFTSREIHGESDMASYLADELLSQIDKYGTGE
tara:strand:+ start:688 stop:2952 length:2265 start_codon:yes stop_codon:yes gene_type:complete